MAQVEKLFKKAKSKELKTPAFASNFTHFKTARIAKTGMKKSYSREKTAATKGKILLEDKRGLL